MFLFNSIVQIKLDPIILNHRRHLWKDVASFISTGLLEWNSNLMWTLFFSFGCIPFYIKTFWILQKRFAERQTHADCSDSPHLGKVFPGLHGGSWGLHCWPSTCWWASGQLHRTQPHLEGCRLEDGEGPSGSHGALGVLLLLFPILTGTYRLSSLPAFCGRFLSCMASHSYGWMKVVARMEGRWESHRLYWFT